MSASQMSTSQQDDGDREQDVLVSRLIARIADLEERLFKAELDAPLVRKDPPVSELTATPSRASESDLHSSRPFLSLWQGAIGKATAAAATNPTAATARPQTASAATTPPLAPASTSGSQQPSRPPSYTGSADGVFPLTPSHMTSIASISGRGILSGGVPSSGSNTPGGTAPVDRSTPNASPAASRSAAPPHLQPHSHGGGGGGTSQPSVPPATDVGSDTKSTASDWLSRMKFSWGAKDSPASGGAPASTSARGTAEGAPGPGGTPGIFRGANGEAIVQMTGFNEKAFEMQLGALDWRGGGGGQEQRTPMMNGGGQSNGSYFRYVFDPVDVEAEMEVTARVRKAAAEALTEANEKLAEAAEKLRAAEEQQEALTRQLEQARQLDKVVEMLKSEHAATLEAKRRLEEDALAAEGQLERTRAEAEAANAEIEGLREAAQIWRDGRSSEQDKLRQENALIRSQLTTRLNELQSTKVRLADYEAEKQRMHREQDDLQAKLKWLQTVNHQLEAAAEQLEAARKAAAEWQDKFLRERNVRRKLHEQLQQLKGNIRVMCRMRPVQDGQRSIATSPLEGLLLVTPPDRRPQEFEFDHVFCGDTTQAAVFEEVSALVRSCADGFNVCIFAFGQTGSGKTYTMEGPASDPGINVRAISELFRIVAEEAQLASGGTAGGTTSASIAVSMIEIYNESVLDLLRADAASRSLEVVGLGPGELAPGQDRVVDLTWRPVTNTDEVKQVLREGWRNRATAATAINAHSSRSHALLTVKVTLVNSADGRQRSSTIHLVDLAGSERVDKSEVTGQQLKEAQSINKSLSALGDVISALQRRGAHIPYRNSKLTQVLQDSLCGSSKVLLVCNISPEAASSSETLSSLNFASRAAQVELGQAKKAMERIQSADKLSSSGGGSDRVAAGSANGQAGGGRSNGQQDGGGGSRLMATPLVRLGNSTGVARQR